MRETLITPQSAAGLVTLARLKQQCRIDADLTDDDDLLQMYLAAAVEACQHQLGRPILPQVWQREFDDPALRVCLRQDVTAIGKVTAITDAAELDLPVDEWRLVRGYQLAATGCWPHGTTALRVRFTCGAWAVAGDVPEPVRLWLMQRVATAYQCREQLADGKLQALPRDFVDGLLDPYRSMR